MKRNCILFLLVILLLTGCQEATGDNAAVPGSDTTVTEDCAASTAAKKDAAYKQITMVEAVEMMASEDDYIIIDVRRPDEFADGHIPKAVNIPNESIGTDEIEALPDKDQLILVYCRSGNRSKQASEKLVKLGYTNVVEFGGIIDWKGEIET